MWDYSQYHILLINISTPEYGSGFPQHDSMNDYQLGDAITIDHILGQHDFGPIQGQSVAPYTQQNPPSQNIGHQSLVTSSNGTSTTQPPAHHMIAATTSSTSSNASSTSNSHQEVVFDQQFQAPAAASHPLNSVYAAAYPATYGQQQYHVSVPAGRAVESYPPTPSPETNINNNLTYHYSRSTSSTGRSPTPSRNTPLLQEFILPIQVKAAPFCDTNDILEMDYEAYDLETFEDYSPEPAANFHPAPYTGSPNSLINSISRDIKKAEEIAITRMKYHSFGYIDLREGMFGKLNLRRPGAWSRCPSASVARKIRRR
ncbi:hypothetical protein B0I72DRAFT_42802 [Yarrowia lipolytica]|uniref:YALI0D06369p n=2 Tax=Yarrowia lipolytica TaxID=4952 RepID=Q6CA30_YARLI|nr:YALI0D06369p [Yarrowia lipolytica CLIB122]AOW03667.1 hypothetical protein YALI1_D08174g [Yarrowia lipolytica]KAB8284413.1 hypothetical protein BKA91DRAFT_6399 [Yarrowia lipolytica]KAE8172611.1 hypothetical protein BKA90DRAFT_16416 [Yarrowia lipolytica]KAJ8054726.1 hypothetical protein LXG23DRAFT_48984 [Yarrowia lipolytica]RDW24008.1 hypothetical protein B0I71DRAFT_6843 [Yarrowia lipolytica]|eukprot:XP_502482.1 YALI0D06369p [Yarrowia lipolytica CLIB122]